MATSETAEPRMRTSLALFTTIVSVAATIHGCGGDRSPVGLVCEPGRVISCLCVGGGEGSQSCQSDGRGYEGCRCPEPDAGNDADDSGRVDTDAGDAPDAATDRDADLDAGDAEPGEPPCPAAPPVDLVFVIDNSHSMQEEQLALASAFPSFVAALTEPRDLDDDGAPDYPPVTELRVGVLSTDMGAGPHTSIPSCSTPTGDDGVFVREARATVGPWAGYAIEGDARWLELDPANRGGFSDGFACLAQLGTDGCGLEQQLESSFVAITRQMDAGQPNEGFFRSNSVIAFVFVTDEDDCSAVDVETFFDPSFDARERFGPLGTRCAFHPGELHPISRYVSAFESLATDHKVVVAGVVGVPRTYTSDPADVDFTAALADPAMAYGQSDTNPNQLAPTCSLAGRGEAHPARRLVQLLHRFDSGNSVVLGSICDPDFGLALGSLATSIGGPIL